MSALEELAALFSSKGARGYLGEPVTQAHHMFLAGTLAERAPGTRLSQRLCSMTWATSAAASVERT